MANREKMLLLLKDRVFLKMLLIKIFTGNSIILSIRILYMIKFGILAPDVSFLKAIFSISVALFEVPAGVFADRMGKKNSLIISSVFSVAHAVVYLLSPNYAGFIVVQILLALSSSFRSGTDIAYIKNYVDKKSEYNFTDFQGEIIKFSKYASAILSIASSAIFVINFRLNFILLSIFGVISLFASLKLPRDNFHIKIERISVLSLCKKYIVESVRDIIKNKPFLFFILITSVNFSFLIFNFEYYQFFLKELGFPVKFNGILYFSFMLLMAVGVNITKKLKKKHSPRKIYTLYTIALISSYLLIASNASVVFLILAITIQQISFGGWHLLLDAVLVEESTDDRICTMASVNNLFINLTKSIVVISLGLIMSFTGILTVYIIMSVILLTLIMYLNCRNTGQK